MCSKIEETYFGYLKKNAYHSDELNKAAVVLSTIWLSLIELMRFQFVGFYLSYQLQDNKRDGIIFWWC